MTKDYPGPRRCLADGGSITKPGAILTGAGADGLFRAGIRRVNMGLGSGRLGRALLLLLAVCAAGTASAQATVDGRSSGLPVPRYVSLKADKVNVRAGPTRDHDVAWVFTRAGIPVEITAESDNWRRIRDAEGAEGWVFHSLLSGRRTVLVAPSSKTATFPLYERPDSGTRVVAKLEPRVLGTVRACDKKWCRIFGDGFDGFIEQHLLWGVYPNETVE
jgi:SH3-like domain-containing protein